jgi:non-canonical (house-cleaning) NTP pyrophosphatase
LSNESALGQASEALYSRKDIRVIFASKNPVKIDAATESFNKAFPESKLHVLSVDAPSNVNDQPMSALETKQGAINRVKYCQQHHQADDEKLQTGRTASLPLPTSIYELLTLGKELGPAMDRLFNTVNIKQKGGAIGQLSKGLETRKSIYVSATLLTLSVFFYPQLY